MSSIPESAVAAEAGPSPTQRCMLYLAVLLAAGLVAFIAWLSWIALAGQ